MMLYVSSEAVNKYRIALCIKGEDSLALTSCNSYSTLAFSGGKKRNIPFRRQRMQIDQPVPPSAVSAYPVPQPEDPYIADLLQVADNR